jgi:hypothetical protein
MPASVRGDDTRFGRTGLVRPIESRKTSIATTILLSETRALGNTQPTRAAWILGIASNKRSDALETTEL